ncbi:MAG: SDR family oxidoreductase [Deltaproteobacteria bacterium]|nr:SDR family oxidoreductase [Deltaproteobacteria bacterium]
MGIFQDKVVIVTGASEGIGRALCIALAPQKPKLVLAARNQDRLEELKIEVESKGAKAMVVPTDIIEETACRHLVEETIAEHDRIDALVNNAGRTMWTTLDEMSDPSIIEQVIRINYLSAAYCTYYALPYLKQSKGRIVGVSSVAGLNGVPTRTAYSASKHAMFGFFDSLRIELLETGVTVTMIAPDFVLSEMHRRAFGKDGQPLGKSPLQEDKVMTSAECAARIVKAMESRDRLAILSARGKLGRWVKLIAPSLIDKAAQKAIRDAR